MTTLDRLHLSGDEDSGVGLNCRDCDRYGKPLAYYGSTGYYAGDDDVVRVDTLDALVAAAQDHVRSVHGRES